MARPPKRPGEDPSSEAPEPTPAPLALMTHEIREQMRVLLKHAQLLDNSRELLTAPESPLDIIEHFRNAFPNEREPSLALITDRLEVISLFFERTLMSNERCLNRRFKPEHRENLVTAAQEVLTPQSLTEIFNYYKELYVMILDFSQFFRGDLRWFIQDLDTFAVNPVPVKKLSTIVSKMKNGYGKIAVNLAHESPCMRSLVTARIKNLRKPLPPGIHREDPANLAPLHSATVMDHCTNVISGAKTGNTEFAKNMLASALEVSLFSMAQHIGVPFDTALTQKSDGRFLFEDHSAFKLDVILKISEVVTSTMASLRQLLDILQKIDRYSHGLAHIH